MNQYASRFRGGKAPVSCLQVDVPIGQAGRVTLAEVEALDALEPYGAGNARPVFCLRGATLDRLQNVGQNRHLKLRLTKGSAQFDGIFFSAVAQTCGVAPATGWTPPSIFRSTSSAAAAPSRCRWWISVPPLPAAPGRRSPWSWWTAACGGRTASPGRRAPAALPGPVREPVAGPAARGAPDGLETDYLPPLRRLSGALQGAEPFCGRCCAWRCSGSGACCSAAAWATA